MVTTVRASLDPPWTALQPVRVGELSSGVGTPSAYVTVEEDGAPLLRIDVHAREAAAHVFSALVSVASG